MTTQDPRPDFNPEDFTFEEDRRPPDSQRRPPTAWIGGAVLILVGLVFLGQNLGAFRLENWWALFILIPAFGALSGAWSAYAVDGRLSRRVGSSLVGAIFFVALTLAFLLDFDFGQLWPFALIGAGLLMLASALLPD